MPETVKNDAHKNAQYSAEMSVRNIPVPAEKCVSKMLLTELNEDAKKSRKRQK